MTQTFQNKTVLITGAASGIGKILTRKALEKGAKEMVLLDYNLDGLEKVEQEFAHFQKPFHLYKVDLSDQTELLAIIDKIKTEIAHVDILINNAGIIVGKNYVDHTLEDINRTMQVNTVSLMILANAFLDGMMQRNSGVISNVASVAGLTSTPQMAVYVASKWAVVGWSEALRLEMKQAKSKVCINCVMPFYINTGMFDGVKSRIIPILDPEKVSSKIMANIEKGKFRTTLPLPYWFLRFSQAIMPMNVYDYVMGDLLGIYDSMSDFKGRK